MLENLLFFTHNPTLAFNNYNNRPSCHCGFKQANGFFKIHVSFLSSDQQSRLCFPEGVSWSSSAPRLPQKELRQEEDEVGGRKVRRWRRDRLQEEGREDYSSISLLLSEIKDGLRINWISPLSRFPQRSNTDIRNVRDELTVNPSAVTTRLDAVSLRTAAGIWTSALPLSSSARSLKQSHWRVHIILLYSNCQQPLASSSRVPRGRSQSCLRRHWAVL